MAETRTISPRNFLESAKDRFNSFKRHIGFRLLLPGAPREKIRKFAAIEHDKLHRGLDLVSEMTPKVVEAFENLSPEAREHLHRGLNILSGLTSEHLTAIEKLSPDDKKQFGRRLELLSRLKQEEIDVLEILDPDVRRHLLSGLPLWLQMDKDRWDEHQEHPHIEHFLHAFKKGDLPSIGGDTSDLLPLDKGTSLVTMTDFSGEGPPANDARTLYQSYIYGALDTFKSRFVKKSALFGKVSESKRNALLLNLHENLEKIHRKLIPELNAQEILGYWDVHEKGEHADLHFISAGAHPIYVLRKQKNGSYVFEEHKERNIFFNIDPDALDEPKPERTVNKIRINNGDKLVLYTDGLCDARDPTKNIFVERFKELLKKNAHLEPEELAALIKNERRKFITGEHLENVDPEDILPEDDMRLRIFELAKGAKESFKERPEEKR